MPDIIPTAYAATTTSSSSSDGALLGMGIFSVIMVIWYIIWLVQAIMGYGTAYRKTKANGDNGVSLFGWMIVYCSLAACIPGLGIYLWKKSKEEQPAQYQPMQQMPQYAQPQQWQQGQPMQPVQPAQPMQPVQPTQPYQNQQQNQNPTNGQF